MLVGFYWTHLPIAVVGTAFWVAVIWAFVRFVRRRVARRRS